jgi:uncharacterized protein (TIGR00156 family)
MFSKIFKTVFLPVLPVVLALCCFITLQENANAAFVQETQLPQQTTSNNNALTNTIGGFSENVVQGKSNTVNDVKKMRDDAFVTLDGNIEKSLGDEKYLFRDNTGATIVVEIDNDIWQGLVVRKEDKIEIFGEVDRKLNQVEVDVKSVKKL